MAADSLQRQAAMSGEPQSMAVPSALTGMRARPSSSRATPPQCPAGSAPATGSSAVGGDGAGSFGSFSHALRRVYLFNSAALVQEADGEQDVCIRTQRSAKCRPRSALHHMHRQHRHETSVNVSSSWVQLTNQ